MSVLGSQVFGKALMDSCGGRKKEKKKKKKIFWEAAAATAATEATRMTAGAGGGILGQQKNAISPFFDASGNKNISATIRIAQEIRCLPYAGFFAHK